MNAERIQQLLEFKHAQDLYIPECKNGPTQMGSHRRLDGWCLVRTWSPVTFIGYEVKVSRSDWMGDQKFTDYLPMCHLLYVVAPKGVVDPRELPPGVGLMHASQKALVTKQKAVRRDISADGVLDTLTYVLMARVQHKEEHAGKPQTREERIATWREWLESKEQGKQLGYKIRGRIGELYREMEAEVQASRRRVESHAHIEQRIRELGFDPAVTFQDWKIEQRLRDLAGAVPESLMSDMARTIQQMQDTINRLRAFRMKAADEEVA